MYEVLNHYLPQITNHRKIFHQASANLLNTIAEDHQLPVIISAHPRSKK